LFADFAVWDDFKGIEDAPGPDATDYIFFILLSIILSSVMFNLLVTIFSDVFGRMKEVELAVGY
jgi:hypothetical protein